MAQSNMLDAFDDCIDLLQSGQNVDDCLRAYPEHAALLRSMLEAGLAVRRANPPVPHAARARVRNRVMRDAGIAAPPRRAWNPGWTRAAAALLAVIFIGALLLFFNRDDQSPLTIEPLVTPTVQPTASATPSPEPTVTPTVTPSGTPTPEPTLIPTVAPSATPSPEPTLTPCVITITASSVNLRAGPGTGYAGAGYGFADEAYPVRAIHTTGQWLEIDAQELGTVWVAADVGAIAGNCDNLPVSDKPFIAGATISEPTNIPQAQYTPPAGGDPGTGGSGNPPPPSNDNSNDNSNDDDHSDNRNDNSGDNNSGKNDND